MAEGYIQKPLGDNYILNGNDTITLHFDNKALMMVALSRRNVDTYALILTDFWSDGYNIIGDSSLTHITISKTSSSNDITITNNLNVAVAILQL